MATKASRLLRLAQFCAKKMMTWMLLPNTCKRAQQVLRGQRLGRRSRRQPHSVIKQSHCRMSMARAAAGAHEQNYHLEVLLAPAGEEGHAVYERRLAQVGLLVDLYTAPRSFCFSSSHNFRSDLRLQVESVLTCPKEETIVSCITARRD